MNKTSLVFIMVLSACAAFGDMRQERKSRAYQSAMSDYSAGRLDAAIDGFQNVLKTEGDSASARFQLACLLQDYRHDWIGAICHYREYLRIEPKSDKAPLAQERISLCEKELAKELAAKYGISGEEANIESERIRKELDESERKINESIKALEEAEERMTRLEQENKRLRRQLIRMDFDHSDKTVEYEESKKGDITTKDLLDGEDDDDETILLPPGVKDDDDCQTSAKKISLGAADLDDESSKREAIAIDEFATRAEETARPTSIAIARAVLEDDDSASRSRKVATPTIPEDLDSHGRGAVEIDSRAKALEDVSGPKAVKSQAAYEEDEGDSSALLAGLAAAKAIVEEDDSKSDLLEANRAPAATKLSDFAQGLSGSKESNDASKASNSRPKTYVVQEGDTLSSIALKFYGRKNEWKMIQSANKAKISTDGRVKAGDTIVLP